MLNGSSLDHHTSPFTSSLASVSIPLFAVGFKALERLEKSLTTLMTLTIPADEGHPKPCCQAFKRWPTTAVNTMELWTRWQTSDDRVL